MKDPKPVEKNELVSRNTPTISGRATLKIFDMFAFIINQHT